MGLLFFWVQGALAQPVSPESEVGHLYVQNFGPETYDASAQNLAITQGADGLLYVGNGSGVLEYDGASWRLIPIPNGSSALSLAVDSEGRIFVGGVGELGYLAPDPRGRMRYVSLLEQIPQEARDFSDVWTVHTLPEGIYFQTSDRILHWTGRPMDPMEMWRSEAGFYLAYVVRGTYYVRNRGGLFTLVDGTLHPVPGGATWGKYRIRALLPHGADAYLVMTAEHGLFRCPAAPSGGTGGGETNAADEDACTRFSPGSTDLLARLRPYSASQLPDGGFAIGTARGGVVLLDRDGGLRQILNEDSGLRYNRVWSTYVDRQGGLWLGLGNGLARVEVSTSVTSFGKTTGLAGAVTSVARHEGRLYATTTLGLYMLEPGGGRTAPRFVAVPGVETPCWSLLSTGQGLLAGCFRGGYNLDQERWGWADLAVVLSFHRSRQNPALIYLGMQNGLARVNLSTGSWSEAEPIDGIGEQVGTIAEDSQGQLWMGRLPGGLLRFQPATNPADAPTITRFGVEDGLPAGGFHAETLGGHLTFVSTLGAGLFRLDPQVGSRRSDSLDFIPDTTFDAFLPQGSPDSALLKEDAQGRVWIVADEASGVAHPRADSGYTFAPTELRRMPNLQIYNMMIEAGGPVWLGGPDGLLRLETTHSVDSSTDYSARIRRVTTATGSLLYAGQRNPPDKTPEPRPTMALDYQDNALRFAFAAPRYDASERIHYRTRLDGFDRAATGDGWSGWSLETDKDYTNLWEGHYVFRVQARDVYGALSREDSFTFRILPPWYRSWWAYGLYTLALGAVVLGSVRFQRQKLRRERAISARLREVDQLKDRILASTSHELRTPLFGITGLAESLVGGAAGELPKAAKAQLEMIAGSGRRLSHLVDDILDHSRLTHGTLRLQRGPVDLRSLTETVLTLQRVAATSKDLELRNTVPSDLPAVDADEARLEQILHNLVGNAIKFTTEGHVEVSAHARGEQIEVVVADTGIGIAEDERERIFLAFEQVDSGVERAFGGTGLGLAVTQRLVRLHGGRIEVESVVGDGARFAFTLPVSHESARPARPSVRPVSRPIGVEPVAVPVGAAAASTGGSSPLSPPEGTIWDTVSRPADGRGLAGARILVVDDEPVNRLVLSLYLGSEDYTVELVENGVEALRLLDQQPFDLVLLDVMMPKMSGYEVCRTLREQHPLEELPVIFLTAKNQVSDLVEGLDAGGNDYLAKPVDKNELLARVRTHLELLSVHRRLATKNAELARFNYTVAHDLRNPLVTIRNFLGLARRDAASGHADRLEADLDRLDSAAERLQQLLDELFELSRVGLQSDPPEEVSLGELVDDALAELAEAIAEREVTIEVASDLPRVVGDRPRLREVVRHLLDNAFRYLGDTASPRVEVGVRQASDDAPPTFYVRDNGMGIDPRYHQKVFGLFERLAPEAEGTGVGLALVQRIVEVHGGRIWVESEGPGQGSTFCWTLPRSKNPR